MTADQFAAWRIAAGLTQAQAGAALGRCRAAIQAYERGRLPVPKSIELATQALSSDYSRP